ncbi:Ig-like domain-containing protein [Streptomyces sp. NPDC101132]|uniref:L,D-transpeptidase n=1 Tax=Streptomyces sp. NPDC101132 TaxID=3366110 RepID=UPI003813DAAA
MTVSRARRRLVWRTLTGVTGVLLVTAAAPDAAPGPPAARSAGSPSVAVLVGRVLDGSGPGCTAGSLRSRECGGWHEQTVRAVPGGERALGAAQLAALAAAPGPDGPLTSAGGPLRIAVAEPARLTDVTVQDAHGRRISGTAGEGGAVWRTAAPLRAGEPYAVHVRAQHPAGGPVGVTLAFRTAPEERRPDERFTVAFGPGSGTYGAGQVITAALSHPVPAALRRRRALVEGALEVTSRPRVEGSWHWVDDRTLHYRPRSFWPAHTEVAVRSGLDGVALGDGRVGGPSEPLRIGIGDRVEAVTDSARHRMTVRRNGLLLRTLPVTTGKEGFRTRSGIKVVLRKERKVRMRGDSIGIKRGTSEFYDLPVHWATRVTWSGEYVHAAPWSVEAQGEENVSHGCTGMSTEDARWFFGTVREGDIVTVVNSGGARMTPFDNGFGDWNLDWARWRAGSALSPEGRNAAGAPSPLHPMV